MSIFDEIEQKAREEGFKEGFEESIKEEKRNTVIRSWKNGVTTSMISNITLLPVVEIEKVIADYQQTHKL